VQHLQKNINVNQIVGESLKSSKKEQFLDPCRAVPLFSVCARVTHFIICSQRDLFLFQHCKELTVTFCYCVSGRSCTIRPTRLARTWRSGSCNWQTRRSTSVKSLSSKFARDVQWCSSSTSLR